MDLGPISNRHLIGLQGDGIWGRQGFEPNSCIQPIRVSGTGICLGGPPHWFRGWIAGVVEESGQRPRTATRGPRGLERGTNANNETVADDGGVGSSFLIARHWRSRPNNLKLPDQFLFSLRPSQKSAFWTKLKEALQWEPIVGDRLVG